MCTEIGILIVVVVSVDIVPHPHDLAHRRILRMIALLLIALAFTEEPDEQEEEKQRAKD